MNGAELVSGWFSPTVLFCVLNIMIGTILLASSRKTQKTNHDGDDDAPPQLVRVPSFLDRVKSINLSRYRAEPPDPIHHESLPAEEQTVIEPEPEPEPEPVREEPRPVTRSKSDSEPVKSKPARVLKKCESEKLAPATEVVEEQWRPATTRAPGGGEDEAVDAKADDFINKFRQQLKLQRMNSILRYKEMLGRSAG